jgi:hypothetical protein
MLFNAAASSAFCCGRRRMVDIQIIELRGPIAPIAFAVSQARRGRM